MQFIRSGGAMRFFPPAVVALLVCLSRPASAQSGDSIAGICYDGGDFEAVAVTRNGDVYSSHFSANSGNLEDLWIFHANVFQQAGTGSGRVVGLECSPPRTGRLPRTE